MIREVLLDVFFRMHVNHLIGVLSCLSKLVVVLVVGFHEIVILEHFLLTINFRLRTVPTDPFPPRRPRSGTPPSLLLLSRRPVSPPDLRSSVLLLSPVPS